MRMTDERLDTIVGVVLRLGVIIAAALVLAGGVAYLIHNPAAPADHKIFRGVPAGFKTFPGIVAGAAALDPLFIIQLGLLVLIATPVLRVIICAAGFALQRDWLYAAVSMIVLALLVYSIAGHG